MPEQIVNFYNQLYKSKQSQAMRPITEYSRFLSYLKLLEADKKILDIACGTGFLLKVANEKGLKTFGIDISDEAVKIAKENSPSSEIITASAENLPFENIFFDYVSCLGSIEHFLDINQGLREMLRVGKSGAKFLLVVPNKNYFVWWFTKNKGTHQRDFQEELKSLKEWRDIFNNLGFKILDIYQDDWPSRCLPWFYSFNPIKILKRLFFKLAWLILPLNYTYQFIFICQKNIVKI
ncbi:hypothetical protein COX27_01785 [Candidatus Kuenenbacteria bacterium CG23_combo_of_CG06-09_8_20_14_all_36_9]|uniref:Methyltransferase type 11 domain-containing protein n=1 Tax=Candidatus Kuenenbacteria bacterium CG10_big_fil_rev_8_21_14_0_10_36_11 TaxID=1974618 RepID=A0A2M6W9S6_9BACT|nr:MAG: hypothetical protein COX27_01785 [Candidatus Kuenenbacteria bacterium CG23_combo_of_CG06-09_8_20_14_all_36_9]PIT89570.1 MAG: hypothetical protein COU23_03115 [Candidatus Kuenenbacteria bacterium CG10_big_fil_rev_8_21_14_0_10_36_11]